MHYATKNDYYNVREYESIQSINIKIVCHFAKTAKTLNCVVKCPIPYSILN